MELTKEALLKSDIFNELATGVVGLIHYSHKGFYSSRPLFIVLHSDMGKWTMSLFWISPNRKDQLDVIRGRNEYINKSTVEMFDILLKSNI